MNATPTILERLSGVAIDASIARQFDIKVSDAVATIVKYKGTASVVDIPSTFQGVPVTSIGGYAFAYCTSLANITIPDSVTNIGDYAFVYCTSLTSITIPSSTHTGKWVFSGCTSLTSVTRLPEDYPS